MSFYGSASIQVRERTRRTSTHDTLEAAELLLVPTEARERRGAAEVATAQRDVPRNDVRTPPRTSRGWGRGLRLGRARHGRGRQRSP